MHDKEYLRKRIGAMHQIAGIRRAVLDDGKGRGMRVFDVRNGSGLVYEVYPDRGLDIGQASFNGVPLAWITPNGPVAPAFYESDGINWLRTWGGGLLTGCGIMNVGGPNISGGESHGLHGRLSHTPATEVNTRCFWDENGKYVQEISGHLLISRIFGKNIEMIRTIRSVMGENTITLEDEVINNGFNRTPLMMLYHINLGWPLVDENSRIETVPHRVTPQNDVAAADYPEWPRLSAPEPAFSEQVFYHEIPGDENGMSSAALYNPDLGMRLTVSCRRKELPYLIQWKQMGQGEYVLGLEPANCFPEGQAAMLKKDMLQYLQPGGRIKTLVKISIEQE